METDPGQKPLWSWEWRRIGEGSKPSTSFVASFPTIEEGSHHRCKPRGVDFPIDLSARRFTRRSEWEFILFNEMGEKR